MVRNKKSCTKEVEETEQNIESSHNSEKCGSHEPASPTVTVFTRSASVTSNYCSRRTWITTDRLNELRKKAQEALKNNKTFTIRGCFFSVRQALIARGWVEKLDVHRKQIPTGVCQVTYEDLAQNLPKRKVGESRRQYVSKCERNILSRFLEHMPIDFLWTSSRKEKCDYIDQIKNPGMTINRFHRAPFTSKEGLCSQLKDFHWFYEEDTAETYFPRCYNVWSPEELSEFIENFRISACIAYIRRIVDKYKEIGIDSIFSTNGKIPFSSIEFAFKRCLDFLDTCQHSDIDIEDTQRVCDHEWEIFLNYQYQMSSEGGKIFSEPSRLMEGIVRTGVTLLASIQRVWPQYNLDGYQNLWIVKPANKCRGRGIQLMDSLKKILSVVNPSIASKSRFVVQKYIERPLTIHNTKFDIRQWFLITNVQPLVVWMYKESYLRFSSQEYSLSNLHESVHLTNHAIQKKYTNGKRDKRLPNENMWDCYSFQAYLRQIGKFDMWSERIYPGMRKAIVGTMLASQDNMDRRSNTFELFGADFMICEDFSPWLIEINSSPDLGATTSVTARMCPQCLEDVIKVVIDRKTDPKSELGNFEQIYRQVVPPTPAYMGLNLFVKGKQIVARNSHHQNAHNAQRRERCQSLSSVGKLRAPSIIPLLTVHRAMPMFNATERVSKCITTAANTYTEAAKSKDYLFITKTNSSSRHSSTLSSPRITTNQNLVATSHSFATVVTLPRTITATAAGTVTTNHHQQQFLSKRHQSCGPRIPLKTTPEKLRCIVKKCTLQENVNTGTNTTVPLLTTIVPSLLEHQEQENRPKPASLKVNRSRRQKASLLLNSTHSGLLSSSPINYKHAYRKRAMYGLRKISDKNLKELRDISLVRMKLDKEQAMTSIHAIGKGIKSPWENSSKRPTINRITSKLNPTTTILGANPNSSSGNNYKSPSTNNDHIADGKQRDFHGRTRTRNTRC